jgi:hypothetical protein
MVFGVSWLLDILGKLVPDNWFILLRHYFLHDDKLLPL